MLHAYNRQIPSWACGTEEADRLARTLSWKVTEMVDLAPASLVDLFENRIPAIRVNGFASPEACDAFAGAVLASRDLKRFSIDVPAFYIGVSQFEYRQNEGRKAEHFSEVERVSDQLQAIFDASIDPVLGMIDLLSANTAADVRVAEEPGYGPYCPCVIRHANAGLHTHSDFAPFNSPGWAIADIDAQITWNLYVQAPDSGGETTVYHLDWEPSSPEAGKRGLPDNGFELREDLETFTFNPVKGDVVLFNPRNPHMVSGGQSSQGSNRISVGSFVGRLPQGDLIVWG